MVIEKTSARYSFHIAIYVRVIRIQSQRGGLKGSVTTSAETARLSGSERTTMALMDIKFFQRKPTNETHTGAMCRQQVRNITVARLCSPREFSLIQRSSPRAGGRHYSYESEFV